MNDPPLPAPSHPAHAPTLPRHTVFFVSDGTGITAETFGNSILSQFAIKPRHLRRPFIDTPDKAHQVVREINHTAEHDGQQADRLHHPRQHRDPVDRQGRSSQGLVLDMFNTFIEPLEAEFGITSNHRIGRFSDVSESQEYTDRIEAINFALAHDDGQSAKNLAEADVILVGVSRSGKTPTSLYLAMQHGIKAANYPLIPEDFERGRLPSTLTPFKAKCFGLTIDPDRLARIRNERRPNSKYASIENCRYEVREGETMMKTRRHRLAVVDAQVDRGDRDDDPARPPAGSADVLTARGEPGRARTHQHLLDVGEGLRDLDHVDDRAELTLDLRPGNDAAHPRWRLSRHRSRRRAGGCVHASSAWPPRCEPSLRSSARARWRRAPNATITSPTVSSS